MGLVLSADQEIGIDALTNLVFNTADSITKAKPWRRRRAVEQAQQNMQDSSTLFNVACWHDLNEGVGGLGQLYFVATHYFGDITLDNPDPGQLISMGWEAVRTGMHGAVEYCNYAFILSELLGAEVAKGWNVSLRNLTEAGLALNELAIGDPHMSLVGPGINAYYRAVIEEDEDAGRPGTVLAALRSMIELAQVN